MTQASTSGARSDPNDRARKGLTKLEGVAQSPTVEKAVAAVREFLDMDVACATEFVETQQVFHVLDGSEGSFGPLQEGATVPLELTICQRVMHGQLPNIIPDVPANELAASLPAAQLLNIGAFASVPLRFSDGRFYGTLCAGSHGPQPTLGGRELQFLNVFARMISDQLEREELERDSRVLELQAATSSALIAAVQARDAYTGEHSAAVVELAVAVARRLGLSGQEITDVENVAALHDIGKIAIPDSILKKPGSLTPEEWAVMRTHPLSSEALIRDVPGLRHLAPAVRGEHERWDGGGYPDGLAGDAIPLASRITLVCDAYDAMTNDRPYRAAMSEQEAIAELEAGIGTQFCPAATGALLALLSSPRAAVADVP